VRIGIHRSRHRHAKPLIAGTPQILDGREHPRSDDNQPPPGTWHRLGPIRGQARVDHASPHWVVAR
jgi:hypothetical protein